MKIVRTYPPLEPSLLRARNRVDDETPRVYVQQYDNTPLLDFLDDLVVMEWDMAVSHEDLSAFCYRAMMAPERVLVGPYKLYPPSDPKYPPHGVYAHRIVTNPAALTMRHVTVADPTCDTFGFGFAYLPRDLLLAFAADTEFNAADRRMTDTNFSLWHYRRGHGRVDIDWSVNPVHLHYDMPGEYPWK